MSSPPIRNALISVSDKQGLQPFAQALAAAGVQIYSTGGTRKHLEDAGIEVQDVGSYTGFPEVMGGRVKTLHPKIFGGILCRHDLDSDRQVLEEFDIASFELVVVNLYPFEATIAREGVTWEEAIEQIDIGGPSLVRAAAKNHKFTTIATAPAQYDRILEEVQAEGTTSLDLRKELAAAAFARTAAYDAVISSYFATELADQASYASHLTISLEKQADLRYGENPHQTAAVYTRVGASGPSLVNAEQLNGKELSYNNLLDLDSALTIARSFETPACSVIKHNNPCGAAVASELSEACRNAMAGDPLSAFGSVLGFNRTVDQATAEVLAEPGLFVEAIVAPTFAPEAVEVLTTKPKWKNNVRLMQVGELDQPPAATNVRYLEGGMLLQDADIMPVCRDAWKVVTETPVDDALLDELEFAWGIVRHVKSNAIVLCKERSLVGAGAGQMSRVDSVDISIRKADTRAQGAVLASDAFFPFPDSIHKAAEAGIAAIIQPGGSKKDEDVIAACNERGIPMIFTGQRHFKH